MRNIFIALILLGFIVLMSYLWYFNWRPLDNNGNGTVAPSPTPEPTQQEANITITSPVPNSTVSLPFTITGEARVFENAFSYRVKDGEGRILADGFSTALSPDIGLFGPYEVNIVSLIPTNSTSAIIEVFSYSAEDGSEINSVEIPVMLDLSNTQTTRIFFGQRGESELDCSKVFPVDRIVSTEGAIHENTINALLKGTTETEFSGSYFTSINIGVELNNLTINNGVASVDFSDEIEYELGGSCRVTNIRSQITETLRQFPDVNSVEISVEGRVDDALQP